MAAYTVNTMSQRNRGVALLTVLLVVALATTTAVAMASRQQLDIRRTENTLYQGQALMYLYGVESWSQQFLAQDRRDNEIDHNGEDWATRLPPLPVEGGQVQGLIEDLQGRFNLNSLNQPDDSGKLARERFERLLKQLEIKTEIMSTIQDWLDADIDPRFPAGAEDDHYLGQEPAYRTANQNMLSPSELLLLKDMNNEIYEKLRPHVNTLPEATPININTASPEVLMSLADDLSKTDIESLIIKREDKAYKSVEAFLAEDIFAGKNVSDTGLSVDSDYFLLVAQADIGHLQQTLTSIFVRDDEGRIQILVRSDNEI
ncbi:MAG: type II secretion system minor pseudopilin GspK [Gammaproteobacteria bacterium]|nr:type II secretion system minor pseudopilin GspK [Gammaproteobacteria bacterium]